MPMSGAERQRRYRERHRDDLARITLDVQVAVRDRLDRLAWHFQWNLTQLVEELAECRTRCRGGTDRRCARDVPRRRLRGHVGSTEPIGKDLCILRFGKAEHHEVVIIAAQRVR
jgi:hypothetical protein